MFGEGICALIIQRIGIVPGEEWVGITRTIEIGNHTPREKGLAL
jgi:hypothetical protein